MGAQKGVADDISEFVDPKKWPQYLLSELRITRERLTQVGIEVTQSGNKLDDLTRKFDEAQNRTWKEALPDLAKYHRDNEHKWGTWTFLGKYRWQTLLAVLLVGMLLAGVLGVPITRVISAYKSIRTLEIISERSPAECEREFKIMFDKYVEARLDSMDSK